MLVEYLKEAIGRGVCRGVYERVYRQSMGGFVNGL